MLTITIKQGKESSLLAKEPFIYLSAIEKVDGRFEEKLKSGATALVQSSKKQFLARAAWSPKSQIRARVWSFDPNEPIDHAFIKRRVQQALAKRAPLKAPANKGRRLIHAEQDGLPGLLVDMYGEKPGYLVCQFQAAGVDAWKVTIVKALIAATGCPNVYEHANELIRAGEGLPVQSAVLAGEEPPLTIDLE